MKELTKVFKGVSIPVKIVDDKNMYFDISGIARKFGKNITEWKNSKRNKEIFKLLEKSNNLKESELIKKFGYETKIHNKLFINFARFISPEFEIEADKILYDILTGKKSLIENEKKELLEKLDKKDNQLAQAQKEIVEAKRKSYAHDRKGDFQCITNIIRDLDIDTNAVSLNKILLKENVIGKKQYISQKYIANNIDSIEEDGNILVNKDTVIRILKEYEFNFKGNNQLAFDFE